MVIAILRGFMIAQDALAGTAAMSILTAGDGFGGGDGGVDPVFIAVDIQKEFATPGRPLHIPDIDGSLGRCRQVMGFARAMAWPVVHLRLVIESGNDAQGTSDGLFRRRSDHVASVPGCEPMASEGLMKRRTLSGYGASGFEPFMDWLGDSPVFIFGYSGAGSILATLYDGWTLGHRFVFVVDASASVQLGQEGESGDRLHDLACQEIARMHTVTTTAAILNMVGPGGMSSCAIGVPGSGGVATGGVNSDLGSGQPDAAYRIDDPGSLPDRIADPLNLFGGRDDALPPPGTPTGRDATILSWRRPLG